MLMLPCQEASGVCGEHFNKGVKARKWNRHFTKKWPLTDLTTCDWSLEMCTKTKSKQPTSLFSLTRMWWVACFQTSMKPEKKKNPASDQKVSVRNTFDKNMLNIQYWSALKQGTWFPVAVSAGRHVMWQTCDTNRKYPTVIVQVARLKTDVQNKHQKTTTTWLTRVLWECLRWDGNPSLAPPHPSETSHV